MRLDFQNTVPLYLHRTSGVNITLVTWLRNSLKLGCPFLSVSACVFCTSYRREIVDKLNAVNWRKTAMLCLASENLCSWSCAVSNDVNWNQSPLVSLNSVCVYKGMWSSIFSINLTEIWRLATGVSPSWTPWFGGGVSNTGESLWCIWNPMSILNKWYG